MSDVVLGVDPNSEAKKTASRTEVELEQLEARRQELLAKKAAEDTIKDNSTLADRTAAVALHKNLCPSDHASLACPWHVDPKADDPEAADWTEEQHRRWLAIAVYGVATLRAIGWTITAPVEE